MAISSPGIGSNLDVNGIVSKLMAIESQPLTRLTQKEASAQAKISAYGSIKGAMSSFQSAMQSVSTASRYTSITATSSDSATASVSASSIATPGSYSVEISKLAKAQKLKTDVLTSGASGSATALTSVNDVMGSGTLSIQLGTFSTGTFTANPDKSSTTVTINSSNNTLGGIRDAINNASAGVTATIVNDGSGYRLSITSNDTGAANSVKISVSDTGDSNDVDSYGLSQLAYDPTLTAGAGKNLTQTQAAQNAELTVDGIAVSKASNTLTDVIHGVTLNLSKTTATDTPISISVSRNASSLTTAAQEFAKAYNDLASTITDLTKYDSSTKTAGLLQGDSAPRSILSQIRNAMGQSVLGLDGQRYTLSSMGISFQKDGTLSVDSSKLSTLASSHPEIVAGLFATTGRASDSGVKYLSASSNTAIGSYTLQVSQMATQGKSIGSASAGLTINGSNNTLSVLLDGTAASVTLSSATYASADALAAEIQSKINGNTTFKNAGLAVSVSNSAGVLTIASTTYGSSSSLTVGGSGASNLLGGSPTTSTGVDVGGSLSGASGTGSGQTLTFDNGIKLSVTSGSSGDRGTVYYTKGFGSLLDALSTQILDTKGSIAAATDGLNSRITDIGTQRTNLNRQLSATETRLRAQFTSLDTLMGKMSTTSTYLSQQLSALSNLK